MARIRSRTLVLLVALSGAAALLVQLNSGITPNKAASAIQGGALALPGQGLGAGRVDLTNAISNLYRY